MTIVKSCKVCKTNHTASTFSALPLCGFAGARKSGGMMKMLEMRNCACGSTLAIEISRPLVKRERIAMNVAVIS